MRRSPCLQSAVTSLCRHTLCDTRCTQCRPRLPSCDSRTDPATLLQVFWWHEKYKPRKPKYFNRVHTGYEWNKYNQTHYDHDNPPPKTVQVRLR